MTIVLAVVIAGGLGFYGGTKYVSANKIAQNNFSNMAGARQGFQRSGMGGANGGQRAGNMAGFVSGEIISKDISSMTLKLQDGGSKIILFSESTQVMKNIAGSADDIAIGGRVTVTGAPNQDGSITANSIRLGEIQMMQAR